MKLKLFIPIITILLTTHLLSKSDEFIEWKPIKGAYGYVIQIRDTHKKVLLNKKVDKHFFPAQLPKGKYEIRVAPLNVFKKPAVWSRWSSLEIIVSRIPILSLDEPIVLVKKNSLSPIVEIRGENLSENTEVTIRKNKKLIPVLETNLNEKELLTFKVNLEKVKVGKYDLILKNPNNKVLTKEDFIIVKEQGKEVLTQKPTVTDEEPIVLDYSTKRQTIEVKGKNFSDQTKASITSQNNSIPIKNSKAITENLLSLDIDLNGINPGSYDLNVENPGSQKSVKKDFIIIQETIQKHSITQNENLKPVITLDEPLIGYYKTKQHTIEIIGKNFINETKVSIIGKDGIDIPIENQELKSPESLLVRLNLENAKLGSYDVILKNPNTQRLRKRDFFIIKTKDLLVKSEKPTTIQLDSVVSKEVDISGENFIPDTNVSIHSDQGSIPVVNKSMESDQKIKLELDTEKIRPGKYDLTLINPSGNQTTKKDFLEIKDEEIPIKEPPNHEDITKYELAELLGYLQGLKKTCKSTNLPDILIEKCFASYVSLDLSTPFKRNLYNFIRLVDKNNYQARMEAYHYFAYNCFAKMKAVNEYISFRLNSPHTIFESFEKRYMTFTLQQQDACLMRE
ncbi:MAG: hypothetical protein H7A23_03265 [Leptospiraceae bacterium]|nr:hypothetical protein [Leptospiraceae bacterium]MCP5493549.1 hypothetical protein [Leptospiraceae bacterium]